MLGKAADIFVFNVDPVRVAQIAKSLGFKGIGVGKNFTHLDIRDGDEKFWVYDNLNEGEIRGKIYGTIVSFITTTFRGLCRFFGRKIRFGNRNTSSSVASGSVIVGVD